MSHHHVVMFHFLMNPKSSGIHFRVLILYKVWKTCIECGCYYSHLRSSHGRHTGIDDTALIIWLFNDAISTSKLM